MHVKLKDRACLLESKPRIVRAQRFSFGICTYASVMLKSEHEMRTHSQHETYTRCISWLYTAFCQPRLLLRIAWRKPGGLSIRWNRVNRSYDPLAINDFDQERWLFNDLNTQVGGRLYSGSPSSTLTFFYCKGILSNIFLILFRKSSLCYPSSDIETDNGMNIKLNDKLLVVTGRLWKRISRLA